MRKLKEYAESIILAIQRKFRYNTVTPCLIIIAILLILFTVGLLVHWWCTNEDDIIIIADTYRGHDGPSKVVLEEWSTVVFPEISETKISETKKPSVSTTEEQKTNSEWISFNVTAYCPCTKCCGSWGVSDPEKSKTATGVKPVQGRTIAADWNNYPPGTVIEFEGLGKYVVEDSGGAIKGNKIDMYFTDHQSALKFGRQQLKGRIVK